MKRLLFFLLFVSNVTFSAAIYQCKDRIGKVNFRGEPCAISESTVKEVKDKSAYSMWIEPNFVDTEYSVRLESLNITKVESKNRIHRHIPFGWRPYYVSVKVVDVYKGELKQGEVIDLLVYITANYQLEKMRKEFILSFCRSNAGVFYTSRDFLIQLPTPANIEKFEAVRESGTDYQGSGDCSGNYPSLNPDSHQ